MTGKWHGGKGSKQIPTDPKYCDNNKFNQEWDRLFPSKKKDGNTEDKNDKCTN